MIEDESPDDNFYKMQIEHEENAPSEQERSPENTRASSAQAPFAAPLQNEDPVKTRTVKQGEKHQDEGADPECRQRLVLIRDLCQ
jgi:hypothetical protein